MCIIFIKALRRAKKGKSSGPDDVHIEVIQLIEEQNIDALVIFLNAVYDTGHLPKDWLASTFITLPKKANAKKCAEFRTISRMSQVLKLFLNIIHERIRAKCDEQLADSQFGFRAGVGTREALFAIQNLYWNQRAKVRVDNEETEDVEIKRGVRQGCILSPTLFNLYSETIIAEAIEGLDCRVKINGRNINNIRYADDTVLIASSLKDIQRIVTRVNMCSENANLG
ncbi:jg5969 [Pararge aegeria aegeria]|uniref:Jg5969 protein n=1 Tax=Pararge aegeria aegeria TaxID=348720 RepID=A0A8S4RDP0_9NEOP|nr:jg5969 [Pararge aegeria aegeria]